MSNQEIDITVHEREIIDNHMDKLLYGVSYIALKNLVSRFDAQLILIDQQANRIRQLETAIAIIDMHNGSINSFDEIEAIIQELGRGIE